MRNTRPMPSPNGSNHARQFLPAGFPMSGPVAAYDAAEGPPPGAKAAMEAAERLREFLEEKGMASEDIASVLQIAGLDDDLDASDRFATDEDDDGDLKPRGNGNLEPRGNNDMGPRGTPGKERFAQDARLRERALQTSKANEANFMRRYPGARKIERI